MKLFALIAIFVAVALSGCATIFASKTQIVSYNAQPPETEVWINGQKYGVTPLKLEMKKGNIYNIEFRKDGYRSSTITLTNEVGFGWILLDIFFWPGLLIDWGTGAWNSLSQDNVNATLIAQNSGVLVDPPALLPPAAAPASSMNSATPAKATTSANNLIAVMSLQAKGIPQTEADLVTEALTSKIQNRGRFRIMERSQMETILGEQGFQSSGVCDNSTCAVEIGKLLSIDKLVVGSMGKLGSSYMLNARLVEVGTGEIIANSSQQIKGDLSNLSTVMDQVATELSR